MFASLRTMGGSLSGSEAVVCVVGALAGDWGSEFAMLGVQTAIVDRFDARCPHANKIGMLVAHEQSDVLLALDTDIVVAEDFSDLLSDRCLVAKPADVSPLDGDEWARLFAHLEAPLPPERFRSHFQNVEMPPYFNSGVLAIPNEMIERLRHAWRDDTLRLLDDYAELGDIGRHSFFTDQFALATARARLNLNYRAEGLAWNFPTHAPLHSAARGDQISPYFLHYHHRVTDGTILASGYKAADEALERVQSSLRAPAAVSRIAQYGSQPADRAFWNSRYENGPEPGSDLESRQEDVVAKKSAVHRFLDEFRPASVLDVGCGDLEAIGTLLTTTEYCGIDISELIIDINRRRFPNRTFATADFGDTEIRADLFEADAVLCLDVLIHQFERASYGRFVHRLVHSARKGGLVSGYTAAPRAPYRSRITAYHEPLTATLRQAGARDIRVVASYRDRAVVTFRR